MKKLIDSFNWPHTIDMELPFDIEDDSGGKFPVTKDDCDKHYDTLTRYELSLACMYSGES